MAIVRRPSDIKAYTFSGQPRQDWPEWLQDYEAYGATGMAKIVPVAGGQLIVPNHPNARFNDTFVIENGRLTVYHPSEFAETFEVIPDDDQEA